MTNKTNKTGKIKTNSFSKLCNKYYSYSTKHPRQGAYWSEKFREIHGLPAEREEYTFIGSDELIKLFPPGKYCPHSLLKTSSLKVALEGDLKRGQSLEKLFESLHPISQDLIQRSFDYFNSRYSPAIEGIKNFLDGQRTEEERLNVVKQLRKIVHLGFGDNYCAGSIFERYKPEGKPLLDTMEDHVAISFYEEGGLGKAEHILGTSLKSVFYSIAFEDDKLTEGRLSECVLSYTEKEKCSDILREFPGKATLHNLSIFSRLGSQFPLAHQMISGNDNVAFEERVLGVNVTNGLTNKDFLNINKIFLSKEEK